MPAMFLGCTYVLMSHYDAREVVSIIRKEKVTHTILVPSQIIGCLQREDFSKKYLSFKICIVHAPDLVFLIGKMYSGGTKY